MDRVMKTMKWQENSHTGEEKIETIDFILADNEEGKLMNEEPEEPHLSDDDNHDSPKAGSIENIVEHVCEKCHKTFRTISNFKKHTDFCRFNGNYHVRKAEMLKNLEKIEKDAVQMENTNVWYCSATTVIKCKVCNKAFQRIEMLRDHLEQHLCSQTLKKSEKICPVCKKCFQSSYNLKVHSRIHTDERPFDCDLCAKKFRLLAALQSHRRSHTGEKPYACSVCKQSFAAKQSFNLHMKRHNGERRHVCSECGKNFIRLSQLRSHTKVHIRPYGCDECNKNFRTQKQLESHVKEHNKCDTCKICFKTIHEYNKHLKENDHCTSAERCKRKNQTYKHNFDSVQSSQFHIHKANQRHTVCDTVSNSSPRVIKIQDSQGESFVTTNSKGKILNTNIEDLKKQHVLKTGNNDQGYPHTSVAGAKSTILLSNEESITVITLESDDDMVEQINTKTLPTIIKTESKIKKSTTLAAAIADDKILKTEVEPTHSEEDLKLKYNVRKLLDKLVDSATLKRFGWPNITEDIIVCKLIENCGYDLTKEQHKFSSFDYATRMRKYVKLFLTVVIQNESIEELLNNDLIDEVIEYVLEIDV